MRDSQLPLDAVLNLEDLLSWLKGKLPDEWYDYCDNNNCPLAQFLRTRGYEVSVCSYGWTELSDPEQRRVRIPVRFNGACLGEPRTFGELLKRFTRLKQEVQNGERHHDT